MILAGLDEFVKELFGTEQSTRELAGELGSPALLPYIEGTCSMTGLRQLRRDGLKASAQHQIHIGSVLQVQHKRVFLGEGHKITGEARPSVCLPAAPFKVTPITFQFIGGTVPMLSLRRGWVRHQVEPVLLHVLEHYFGQWLVGIVCVFRLLFPFAPQSL